MSADLTERVAQFLHLYSTQSRPLRLGVAISGGADSVSLLHILYRLSTVSIILHVNHGLRGFDSQNDELFVRELAASLGLPVEVKQEPPAPGNLEAEARRIRRAFFSQVRHDRQLDFVALGHTASDQAETVLFRLLRGSGLRGLGGMAPARNGFLRPFLTSTRDEVRHWARTENIAWREDKSNDDLHFRRNWLRFAILPEVASKLNPKLTETLCATATVARDEEAWLSAKTARILAKLSRPLRAGPDLVIDAARLRRLHPALQRRLIRAALERVRGHLLSLDIPHIEAVRQLLTSKAGHDRVQVPGADILRSFDSLLIARPETLKTPRDYTLDIPLNAKVYLPSGQGVLGVNPVTPELQNCANVEKEELVIAEEAELDEDAVRSRALGLPLKVRNWQPGDAVILAPSNRPVKLKSLFQENRVVLWERRHWPVLIVGNEIAWSRRFGVAAPFAATAGSRRLRLVRYNSPEGSGELSMNRKTSS